MSSRPLKIDTASVDTARIQKIELQDRITLGPARVQKLKVNDFRLEAKPARLVLKDVKISVDLSLQLGWSFNPPGPGSWGDTASFRFDSSYRPHPDIDIPTPGLTLAFAVGELSQGPLQASMDPILAADVPALLASLVVKGIETGNIVLPTAGFALEGLGLGSLVLRDLQVPAVHLDHTKVAEISAEGNIPIPRLGMSGITLTPVGVGQLDTSGLSFSVGISPPSASVNQSYASFTATPSGSVTISAGKLQLKDVMLSGHFGSIVLDGIELTFDARGIRLSPVELEGVTAHELALEGDVKMSPIWGGPGGSAWKDELQAVRRLAKVEVKAANLIDSIRSTFERTDGSLLSGPVHGGSGGTLSSLQLQPNEYFTAIQGQYENIVRFLELRTNLGRQITAGHPSLYALCKLSLPGLPAVSFRVNDLVPGQPKTFDPPGPAPAMTFHVPPDVRPGDTRNLGGGLEVKFGADNWFRLDGVQILGFHGRSGSLLDAIGVLYR